MQVWDIANGRSLRYTSVFAAIVRHSRCAIDMTLTRSRAQASETGKNYVLEARLDLGAATLPSDSLTTVSCFDSQA